MILDNVLLSVLLFLSCPLRQTDCHSLPTIVDLSWWIIPIIVGFVTQEELSNSVFSLDVLTLGVLSATIPQYA